jgi:hypothetical protein
MEDVVDPALLGVKRDGLEAEMRCIARLRHGRANPL